MKKILYPSIGLALLVILIYSCKKYDVDNVEVGGYDAEYAIPLLNTSTTLTNVLENFDTTTFILIGDDGLITLNYKGDVTGKTSEDLFEILSDYELIPIPLEDTATFIPYEEIDGVDIDYAILKSGTIGWAFQSDHDEPVEVTLTLPSITKDGAPYTSTFSAPAGPGALGGNFPFGTPDDLTGYRLETVNDTIYVNYVAHRLNSGIMDTLTACGIIFENLVASYIEGYLGNAIYELDRDTIEIDFFEDWTRGDVYFEDPKLTLTVENSFGIPVRSKANLVEVHTVEGEVLPLESDYLDSIDIAYPSLDQVGEVFDTYFDFNKDNSNIETILSSNPTFVDYDMDAVPNPDSLTSIRGFVTDSSYIKVQVEVELPVWGSADGFVARDTFETNFESYDDVDHVEFKMVTENEIGLNVGMQIYFADENNMLLDSLLPAVETVMTAAPVDNEGNATGVSEKTTFIEFGAERFDKIRTAKRLFVAASFSTVEEGSQSIKVYSEDEVRVRVGMKLGVKR